MAACDGRRHLVNTLSQGPQHNSSFVSCHGRELPLSLRSQLTSDKQSVRCATTSRIALVCDTCTVDEKTAQVSFNAMATIEVCPAMTVDADDDDVSRTL